MISTRTVRRTTRLAIATMAISSLLVAGVAHGEHGQPGGTFTDDDGNPHEGYIEAIVSENITGGCGGTEYCPGREVTREQMATFLARAAQLPPASRDYFGDDNGTPHEDNINRVAEAGITRGDGAGNYSPRARVGRDQMATFLVRAFDVAPTSTNRFDDDNGNSHEPNINALAEGGIAGGCGERRYCPGDAVLRANMATFLGRALTLEPHIVEPRRTFGEGTKRVGEDIVPDTYRSGPVAEGCYWERLSGFGGSFEEIKANEFTNNRTVVTIDPSDEGFGSSDCGTWSNDLRAITESPTAPFGSGTWIVRTDIAPGTWRNSDSTEGCYWARLSGFSGEFEDIIANEFTEEPTIVEIGPEDAGFSTNDCGTWTRVE